MTTAKSASAAEWGFPNRVTPVGSANYYAVRFSPAERHDLYAMLLAWHDLIRDVAHDPANPGVARLKLDWWRSELDGVFAGNAPRHPLLAALRTAGLSDAAAPTMRALIDSSERQIRHPQIADDTAFGAACHASGGNLFLLLCQPDAASAYNPDRCAELGAYWDAVDRVRRVAIDPAMAPVSLHPTAVERTDSLEWAARCRDLTAYPGNRSGLRSEPVPDVVRRLTAVTQAIHRRMERRGYAIDQRVVDRAPIAHLWTAWRCHPSF